MWFDRGSASLLARAYAADRGTWVATRLANPTAAEYARCLAMGIDPYGPDNPSVPGRRGGLNCRDRWMRAFVRSLYYQHRNAAGASGLPRLTVYRADALQVDVGRRLVPRGIIPAGRAIRIQIRQGGRAAYQAALRLPDRDRIFSGDEQGDRSSAIELRDWEAG